MGKYEEALERAREIYNAPVATIVTRTFLEQIFPELKESEDERIRKQLVDIVAFIPEANFSSVSREDCRAYLEKQKEQKPIFKKGDRVIWDGEEFNILDVDKDTYNVGGYIVPFSREGELHLIGRKPAEWNEVDTLTLDSIISIVEDWESEQSAAEKEYYGATQKSDFLKALPERFNLQPKQEWSEEDETCLEYALWCVTKTRCCVAKDACDLDACRCAERWLNSLRPHWKPSEEQMKALKLAYEDAFECPEGCVPHLPLKLLYEQLKKL